ncbi:hypothetical protein, partial [Lactobacillus helveticus]
LKLASSSSSLKTTLLIYPTFPLLANPLFVRVIDDTHGCVVTYFLFSTLLFANLLFIYVFYRHLSSAITELLVQNIFLIFLQSVYFKQKKPRNHKIARPYSRYNILS